MAEFIDIKGKDGTFAAYLALPPTGKGPGIVLFQEIFGVNRHIRACADQYALDGYVVLAPDMFWRQQPRLELGYSADEIASARGYMNASTPDEQLADIAATVAALKARPEMTGRIGAVGYCMGGRMAYFTAATAGIDAASCWYGGGIHDHLDKAAAVKCPIQFHYGEKDAMIPIDPAVASVKMAFAGKPAEVYVYRNADHGFNCWERGTYYQPAAALAHGRTLAFFATHLSQAASM
jgi:carboxymethylenebutenolidase